MASVVICEEAALLRVQLCVHFISLLEVGNFYREILTSDFDWKAALMLDFWSLNPCDASHDALVNSYRPSCF